MFDNDLSAMVDRESPEGREIRRLAKQRIAKTCLQRKGGAHTLPAWIAPPEKLNDKGRLRVKPQQAPVPPRTDTHGDEMMEPGLPRPGR